MNSKLRYKAKKIKAVFFDIDDTLRRKSTGYMPETISYVFEQLKANGIATGIATGRAFYGIVPEILALEPDYFVTINGAYVESGKGETVFDQPVNPDLVKDYVAWCREIGIDYGFTGKEEPVVSAWTDLIKEAMVPVYGDCPVDPDYHLTHDVYQLWTFSKDNGSLELPDNLAAHLRLVPWHEHSSDGVQMALSKASGLEKVLEAEHWKSSQILFFGDGPNDMEIFDVVGLSIAMGNAVPALKEKADWVTGSVEEDGIYQALVDLGLITPNLHFPQLEIDETTRPQAIIHTNLGDLQVKLFPDHAPKTVANFLALAQSGYYDGVIFHRIIEDFMIQGGDPTGTGMGGESIYGESFEDEFSAELYHLYGALAMANAGPNTNGSQFFIVQNQSVGYSAKELERGGWPSLMAKAYASQGGTPHLDRRHTVFGQLCDSESYVVLNRIAQVETDYSDKPLEDVIITTIEVIES